MIKHQLQRHQIIRSHHSISNRHSTRIHLNTDNQRLLWVKNHVYLLMLNQNTSLSNLKVNSMVVKGFIHRCIQTINYLKNTEMRSNIDIKKNRSMIRKKWMRNKNSHTKRMAIVKIYIKSEIILLVGSSKKSWPKYTSIVITWSKN